MQKILFLHSSAELYGSDRSLLNIIHGINKSQREIYVFLPNEGPLVDRLDSEENVHVYVQNFAVLRRKYLSIRGMFKYATQLLISIIKIFGFIKRNNIDVVYTNTAVIFPGAIAAKLAGVRSIWHVREIISNRFENLMVSKMINHFSDAIVANSKATGTAIHGDERKLRVVYNAVTGVPNVHRDYTRAPVVIGMAGRINHWKGQFLFVEMAAKVHADFPDTKFVIAGDAYPGDESIVDELKTLINKYHLEECVSLLGRVSNMKKFYDDLDIFVLPSIQPEPFGLVVIEAMNSALPVVATRHGGPVEIISDHHDGLLVDFTDPDEMTQSCEQLISSSSMREKLGRAAMRKKETSYSVTSMTDQIDDILSENNVEATS